MEILLILRITLPFFVLWYYTRFRIVQRQKQFYEAGSVEMLQAHQQMFHYFCMGITLLAVWIICCIIGGIVWLYSK